MSALVQALVLAAVQGTSRWPDCRLLPAPSGDDRGARNKSARSFLQPLPPVRLSLTSPGAPRFVPDRSIGGAKSWAALVVASPKWSSRARAPVHWRCRGGFSPRLADSDHSMESAE